jgi:hypothetical protein
MIHHASDEDQEAERHTGTSEVQRKIALITQISNSHHHRHVSARIKLIGHTNHDGIQVPVLLQRSRNEILGRESPYPGFGTFYSKAQMEKASVLHVVSTR